MSIRIIKEGMADSIQDTGRFGYQHLGINPGGAMDTIAAQTANLLVGNQLTDAVIELHYPSSGFLFEKEALFAISGADFGATINNVRIPVNRPIIIEQYGVLQFKKPVNGVRAYLAIKDGYDIMKWMNGYGTHLTAKAGGYKGRYLKKNDELNSRFIENYATLLKGKDYLLLPWKVDIKGLYSTHISIRIIPGNEYDWLTDESKQRLQLSAFTITSQNNRTGYRMRGEKLFLHCQQQLLSTGVTKGTIQLLPNGQVVILMADHPTTGGYPRIGHIISADFPKLAQLNTAADILFRLTQQQRAEDIFYQQQFHLQQLQKACNTRLQEYLNKHGVY